MIKQMAYCLKGALSTSLIMAAMIPAAYSQTNFIDSLPDSLDRAENTVPELANLTIIECVKVLNFKTSYQVNLEMDKFHLQSQYRLSLKQLQELSIEVALTNLLSETGDYEFVRNNNSINIVPRHQSRNTNYVFNRVLQAFGVKEKNIAGTFAQLCKVVPQIAITRPVFVGIESSPDEIAREESKEIAGPPFSFSTKHVSVRFLLNRIAGEHGSRHYWVSESSRESPPKWNWILIYRPEDGKEVLWKHDPGLREKMQEFMTSRGIEWP